MSEKNEKTVLDAGDKKVKWVPERLGRWDDISATRFTNDKDDKVNYNIQYSSTRPPRRNGDFYNVNLNRDSLVSAIQAIEADEDGSG